MRGWEGWRSQIIRQGESLVLFNYIVQYSLLRSICIRSARKVFFVPYYVMLRDKVHCKKRLATFPSPAAMSLTAPWAGILFQARESLVSDIPAGDENVGTFLTVCRSEFSSQGGKNTSLYPVIHWSKTQRRHWSWFLTPYSSDYLSLYGETCSEKGL